VISGRRHSEVVRQLSACHERERERLLKIIEDYSNRLMWMAGRAWEMPEPEYVADTEPPNDDFELAAEALVYDEQ
jgi:hypothetical protein